VGRRSMLKRKADYIRTAISVPLLVKEMQSDCRFGGGAEIFVQSTITKSMNAVHS
jgi:hypothetical protein